MTRWLALVLVIVLVSTAGCANMTAGQQRTLSGAAIGGASGAASGALLGAIVGGNPAIGAGIGGAVGIAAGALWGDIQKTVGGERQSGG